MQLRHFLSGIAAVLLFSACSGDYTPKPRAFFRIDLPKKAYQTYNSETCPFSFDYPVYAKVAPDDDKYSQPCWINIDYPQFKGRLHLSYKAIKNSELANFVEDSRGLAYKHTIKANAINERLIHTKNNVYGIMYDIGGNTASSLQFFITDSTRHFMRGSLYFYAVPQSDSLGPVIQFITKDIEYMINTFKWKK
jgi:gliding motility-associated lipoprotein GldD